MVQQNDMTQLLSRGKYLEPTNDSLTDWKPAQLYLAVWADLYGSSRLQEPFSNDLDWKFNSKSKYSIIFHFEPNQ